MSHAVVEDRNVARAASPAPTQARIPGAHRHRPIHLLVLAVSICLVIAAAWEARSAELQSWFFWRWSSALNYTVEAGPSPRIAFPLFGPFDERLGYTRLRQFAERLTANGFRIAEQARQDPGLAALIHWGVSPPYREPSVAGLVVRDADGRPVYNPAADSRVFERFEDVPPLISQTLLFIENRRIDERAGWRDNPAIDLPRSSKALLLYAGRGLGLDLRLEGGSTLATQIEKYRHSRGGRTASATEKLRQVIAASLKAYHAGRDTRDERTQVILDYLNTMPLGAVAGVGEVHGLGDGLRTWFGMDLADVQAALDKPTADLEKARAYRHVLALLYAVHAPTHFLVNDRRGLELRIDAYARLLHGAGVIDAELLNLVQRVPLEFAPSSVPDTLAYFVERKAINSVRLELAELLRVRKLYELDGLHLQVDSTIDGELQDEVTQLLSRLAAPRFVAASGLKGPRMLGRGDPRGVTYSFVLLESRPEGNLVRVHTDTRDAPFDVNEGTKLELGSTAKLRTLAHYLDVVARLHDELSPLDAAALARRAALPQDPLSRWATVTLRARPDLDLSAFVGQALERQYSASPGESFFTGGGLHQFRNFESADNGRVMSIREAAVRSTNLVFVRLMRDVVRFHEARLPYDAKAVLEDTEDSVRLILLAQIGDEEAQQRLAQAYRRYRSLAPEQIVQRLLEGHEHSPRDLAIVFYAWHAGDAPREGAAGRSLKDWLEAHAGHVAPDEVKRLERAYGNPRLTTVDFAYLLKRHPLDLWCAGELIRNPRVSWSELLESSGPTRRLSSAWLFQTRNRRAQDLRLRTRIERDAFAQMTPYWRDLGFAFDELVPSYATAIGSSADRPIALAELMGIIVNEGRRRPTTSLARLGFGLGSPYHTVFEIEPQEGRQVMRPPVARLLRDVLAEVVERGTAIRVRRAFVDENGLPIRVGGKTGSGDNRIEHFARGRRLVSSQASSRTAGFVFYLGDRWFGVITASVLGAQSAQYEFTSSLPLAVLKLASPALNRAIRDGPEDRMNRADDESVAVSSPVNPSSLGWEPAGRWSLASGANYAR